MHYLMKKLHFSKGMEGPPCINPGYEYSLIDKQFYHKCSMANRNGLQASGNVTGNLKIENTYAINFNGTSCHKGGFALHTLEFLKLEVPVNQ